MRHLRAHLAGELHARAERLRQGLQARPIGSIADDHKPQVGHFRDGADQVVDALPRLQARDCDQGRLVAPIKFRAQFLTVALRQRGRR